MTINSVFIPDANVFIEASRRYYAFDIAPAFWEALIAHSQNRHIVTIDRIMDEIEQGNDILAEWIKALKPWCKSSAEDNVLETYRDIITWSYSQSQFTSKAKSDFAGSADAWLIAHAKARGLIVVTHEVFDPNIKRKIPIPNVCKAFNVPYIDTFNMLRRLGVKFSNFC